MADTLTEQSAGQGGYSQLDVANDVIEGSADVVLDFVEKAIPIIDLVQKLAVLINLPLSIPAGAPPTNMTGLDPDGNPDGVAHNIVGTGLALYVGPTGNAPVAGGQLLTHADATDNAARLLDILKQVILFIYHSASTRGILGPNFPSAASIINQLEAALPRAGRLLPVQIPGAKSLLDVDIEHIENAVNNIRTFSKAEALLLDRQDAVEEVLENMQVLHSLYTPTDSVKFTKKEEPLGEHNKRLRNHCLTAIRHLGKSLEPGWEPEDLNEREKDEERTLQLQQNKMMIAAFHVQLERSLQHKLRLVRLLKVLLPNMETPVIAGGGGYESTGSETEQSLRSTQTGQGLSSTSSSTSSSSSKKKGRDQELSFVSAAFQNQLQKRQQLFSALQTVISNLDFSL